MCVCDHLWKSQVAADGQGAYLHVLRDQRDASGYELVHLAPAVEDAQGGVLLQLRLLLSSPILLLQQSWTNTSFHAGTRFHPGPNHPPSQTGPAGGGLQKPGSAPGSWNLLLSVSRLFLKVLLTHLDVSLSL